MERIYKYKLDIIDNQILRIPKGGVILSCQIQKDDMFLWVKINDSEIEVDRQIKIIGTGNPIDETRLIFIDTVQMMGGDIVFHVFELTPPHKDSIKWDRIGLFFLDCFIG